MNGALPWYKSPVMIGAVVTIVSTLVGLTPKLAAQLGLTTPGAIQTTVDGIFQFIALVAGIYTAIKRQSSVLQPLTLTQAAADAHPANQPAPVQSAAPVPMPLPLTPASAKPTNLDTAINSLQGKTP